MENCRSAPSGDADERRELVDEKEVIKHGKVPGLQELGAARREEISEPAGLKPYRRLRLRCDRRQRLSARWLDAHGKGGEAECRVVEGGEAPVEHERGRDLAEVGGLDAVRVGMHSGAVGIGSRYCEKSLLEHFVDGERLGKSVREAGRRQGWRGALVAKGDVRVWTGAFDRPGCGADAAQVTSAGTQAR